MNEWLVWKSFSSKSPLYNFQQKALRHVNKNRNAYKHAKYAHRDPHIHQKPTYVNRRGGGYDEDLTPENRKFLEETLVDKFKLAESPLKEGPWKRGEFNPNSVYVIRNIIIEFKIKISLMFKEIND